MTIKTIPLPTRSTKETKAYAQAVARGLESYFVIQNGKGWYVRKASAKSSNGKVFPTKTEAIDNAESLATKRNSEVLVFSNKGALISRQSPK